MSLLSSVTAMPPFSLSPFSTARPIRNDLNWVEKGHLNSSKPGAGTEIVSIVDCSPPRYKENSYLFFVKGWTHLSLTNLYFVYFSNTQSFPDRTYSAALETNVICESFIPDKVSMLVNN